MKTLPELLSELPDGRTASSPLSWDETIVWLRSKHFQPLGHDARRMAEAAERSEFYRDRGEASMLRLIQDVFSDRDVKMAREKWVPSAGYNNVTRRVVHELATLYRRPAQRSVGNEADNLRYQTVLSLVGMDPQMLELQRLTILHRAMLVGFRVASWSRIPVLDLIEPSHFRLVTHPLDPRRLIAVILEQAIDSPMLRENRPAYLVWTATESFRLTTAGHLVDDPVPHSLGQIPYLLVALSPPPGCLIDCSTFSDVIRAHKAVWFENVLLLKESRDATHTTVFSGDTAQAARRQSLDTTTGIALPEGVSATPLDMSMDLAIYRDTADHILERAAANHGIPPAVLRSEGATSGYEIELRYVGIRERRIEQEPLFRNVERELAELMSVVLRADLPTLAFSTEGWGVNFGEVQLPLSAKEELEVFETRRRMGLTDTVEELKRLDPDLTDEAAWDQVAEHVENETKRIALMRGLQAMSGAMSTPSPGDPTQQETPIEGDDADDLSAPEPE